MEPVMKLLYSQMDSKHLPNCGSLSMVSSRASQDGSRFDPWAYSEAWNGNLAPRPWTARVPSPSRMAVVAAQHSESKRRQG
ncbi:hypothetical protein V6N13_113755 [Hibiscus sabdariffa]